MFPEVSIVTSLTLFPYFQPIKIMLFIALVDNTIYYRLWEHSGAVDAFTVFLLSFQGSFVYLPFYLSLLTKFDLD